MKRVVVLMLLCLLNMEARSKQAVIIRPTDFNFVLRYGSSEQLVLDTYKGTFTRDADLPKFTVTVNLKLTADELDEVFRGLARIDFWNETKYPRVFSYPPPIYNQRSRVIVPCGRYFLSVTSQGRVKELSWEDCILEPTYAPADELRSVFQAIDRFIVSKPEYQALPRSQAPPRI
jgi:hypothetical protein